MLRSCRASMTTCIDWICANGGKGRVGGGKKEGKEEETHQVSVDDLPVSITLFLRVASDVVQAHLLEDGRL